MPNISSIKPWWVVNAFCVYVCQTDFVIPWLMYCFINMTPHLGHTMHITILYCFCVECDISWIALFSVWTNSVPTHLVDTCRTVQMVKKLNFIECNAGRAPFELHSRFCVMQERIIIVHCNISVFCNILHVTRVSCLTSSGIKCSIKLVF